MINAPLFFIYPSQPVSNFDNKWKIKKKIKIWLRVYFWGSDSRLLMQSKKICKPFYSSKSESIVIWFCTKPV